MLRLAVGDAEDDYLLVPGPSTRLSMENGAAADVADDDFPVGSTWGYCRRSSPPDCTNRGAPRAAREATDRLARRRGGRDA